MFSKVFKAWLCNAVWIMVFLIFGGCSKHYVNVTKIDIRRSSLASSFAKTPDLRQKHPPKGEQLLVEWNLPSSYRDKKLILELHVIYLDCSEEILEYSVETCRGEVSYFLLGENYQKYQGFMTYKAQIKNLEGQLLESCSHALFFKKIPLDEDSQE